MTWGIVVSMEPCSAHNFSCDWLEIGHDRRPANFQVADSAQLFAGHLCIWFALTRFFTASALKPTGPETARSNKPHPETSGDTVLEFDPAVHA